MDYELRQLSPSMSAQALTDRVLAIARMEGKLRVWSQYETVSQCAQVDYPDNPELVKYACMKSLVRTLIGGADDTWSGRGNDTRRACYDGKLEAAEEIYYDILRIDW